jgi:hypothetical protein
MNGLGIPTAPHTAVFRKVVALIQADPQLKKVVKKWCVWEGSPDDRLEPAPNICPMISLVPSEGPDEFYGPSGFLGPLLIHVGMAVQGTKADDLLDLYHQIRRSLYPRRNTELGEERRIHVRSSLTAEGADTGEPEFTQAAFGLVEDDLDGPMLIGAGQIKIDLRTIDP